jgi:hypothetical protein
MVFEVYLEGKNKQRHTVLDIEYYLDKSNISGEWISRIKVTNIVDGIARFVEKKMKDNPKYNVLQFITDTNAVRDIEQWLVESPDNRWSDLGWASPHHYGRMEHIRSVINEYAKKYELKVNED